MVDKMRGLSTQDHAIFREMLGRASSSNLITMEVMIKKRLKEIIYVGDMVKTTKSYNNLLGKGKYSEGPIIRGEVIKLTEYNYSGTNDVQGVVADIKLPNGNMRTLNVDWIVRLKR